MKVVIQRVISAELQVDNKFYSAIGNGLVVLVAVSKYDTKEDINWIANKLVNLRIFSDENNQMNLSVGKVGGDIMIISQFTLYASTKKGNRPSFTESASGHFAEKVYLEFINVMNRIYKFKVKTGKFGYNMNVILNNDGPVTIVIDSKAKE
tara:strand:+ start:2003 stop:2455 length:453 start_codon:yes stop_codon:yes gene_type:complete